MRVDFDLIRLSSNPVLFTVVYKITIPTNRTEPSQKPNTTIRPTHSRTFDTLNKTIPACTQYGQVAIRERGVGRSGVCVQDTISEKRLVARVSSGQYIRLVAEA